VLDRYNVKYIVVGPLERVTYVPDGADPSLTQDPAYISPSLTKFDQMAEAGALKVVFQNEGTKIYEVIK
jgi:uncharacterized membrane protein